VTYRELLDRLTELHDDQLECDVTVHDVFSDEYHDQVGFDVTGSDCDVLDEDHPILVLRK